MVNGKCYIFQPVAALPFRSGSYGHFYFSTSHAPPLESSGKVTLSEAGKAGIANEDSSHTSKLTEG